MVVPSILSVPPVPAKVMVPAPAEPPFRISKVPPEIVVETIRTRTWNVCESLQKITAVNIAKNGVDYIEGAARLGSDRKVIVTEPSGAEHEFRAKVVLIATGSRPSRHANISFDLPGVCDTDTILHRGRVPQEIVIAGGGPVGVEFATICHALGAKVTIVERGTRLLGTMDAEMAARLSELFAKWGISVLFESSVTGVVEKNGGLEVALSTGGTVRADTLLFATGRVANTEDLGLDVAGVAIDPRGRIVVDNNLRTTAEGVYAAGDVLGPTLASIAMEQGRVATCNGFGIPFEGTIDPTPVSAVYGMPEVSGAGLTEEQCREKGLDYQVGRSDLEFTPRGAIAGRGVTVKRVEPEHVRSVTDALTRCGFPVEVGDHAISIHANGNASALELTTEPYPGFPTDMQAQMCALLATSRGTSSVTENIFPQRYMHVAELKRMGAHVDLEGATAIIKGVDHLFGAPVMASDLRASAALVLAGLKADGVTEVSRVYHIDRGYEHLDEKLSELGAHIERVKE